MSSVFGENLKLSIFGQSHGPAIGMTLDGIPAGNPVDLDGLNAFLSRRAPGKSPLATGRKEADRPEFLSGLVGGFTCGAPITAVIYNQDARPADYSPNRDIPRPGHADFTAQMKYGGYQDASGGGHFSGRLTAPLCIAGGLCKQWLKKMGIQIGAHISQIGSVTDVPFNPMQPEIGMIGSDFPVLQPSVAKKMQLEIQSAKEAGDSVGGSVTCAVTGLPAGIGEPMFGGIENRIAQIVYGIPAVKAVSFGAGAAFASMRGSEANDAFIIDDGKIKTATNFCGGILGGISTGMPILFTVTFKPTPSIALPQSSVSMCSMTPAALEIKGRHDPCIVPRAVPVVEAAAAVAIYDLILGHHPTESRK